MKQTCCSILILKFMRSWSTSEKNNVSLSTIPSGIWLYKPMSFGERGSLRSKSPIKLEKTMEGAGTEKRQQ